MKHFDLFSGYGGFSLALEKIYDDLQSTERIQQGGMEKDKYLPNIRKPLLAEKPLIIGFSEIDKYASAVLKYHWPNTKNYGDIKKINWSEVPDFDLLTGGSPCQDLSIAGKRKGLTGERSGLFYEYVRALQEKKPRYFIWENVKGALSSNGGRDFARVLNAFSEAGYSLWWQVLNAKDFGVPQNRERIFVIGFRDGSPREIFFERESNIGVNEPNGKTAQTNIARAVDTRTGSYPKWGQYIKQLNNPKHSQQRVYDPSGISPTISAGNLGGGKSPSKILQLNNPTHSNNRLYSEEGISPALNTAQGGNRQPKICQPVLTPDRLEKRQNGRRMKEDGEPSFTLTSQDKHGIYNGSRIRRLTPTECERLMGLPDNWLKYGIDEKGNKFEVSDSQKYKMAGNGVVVNVVEELIKQIII